MSATKPESLQRAIDYLGAVEVATGRYAWFDESQNGYRIASNLELYIPDEEEGYASFCESANPVEMPAWWTPERRFAWRVKSPMPEGCSHGWRSHCEQLWLIRFTDESEARKEAAPDSEIIRFTADLETGAEVPA